MGVFDDMAAKVFARYHAQLTFNSKLMGGTPKDPKLIEGWLRSKAGVSDTEEIRRATLRTLAELGAEVKPDMSYDDMAAASELLAATKQTMGFKRNEAGLYIESRAIKAMLKECTNIGFAGIDRWGPTNKGPKSFLAERVFISPDAITLGVGEPSGVEPFVGHISDKGGPRSTLTYVEYVANPVIQFDVLVARDAVCADHWAWIWTLAQRNGLGALRSQGFGTFEVTAWDLVTR